MSHGCHDCGSPNSCECIEYVQTYKPKPIVEIYENEELPDGLPDEAETMIKDAETDDINKPQHYTLSKPASDCFSVMQQIGLLDDHCAATAFAYLWRCKIKKQYVKDLKKARFYIDKAIEIYEQNESEKKGISRVINKQ